LLEKPLGLTLQDSIDIIELCEKEGVKLGVGLMMRYHAYHQAMKNIIDEGKLGKLTTCRAQFTCWYPDIPGAWRQVKALAGGGSLTDMGVHCIDLLQYIIGSKAKKVVSFCSTNSFSYDVEDQSSTMLELENGAFAYVDANFNIPDAAAKCRMEIYGTRGSILAEGTISQIEAGNISVVISEEGGYDAQQNRNDVAPLEIEADFGNMYTKEIESFGRSITDGVKIEVPAADAIQVQKVIEAAYESVETGKVITL